MEIPSGLAGVRPGGLNRHVPAIVGWRSGEPRHEEMDAFMTCAHAKFTGEVGCCLATSGPGDIHLLIGRYDARMDHQPVGRARRGTGRHALHVGQIMALAHPPGWRPARLNRPAVPAEPARPSQPSGDGLT
jgi:Thiamine pyrophosphate enzyme, N-terminal TPP binding domain